MKENKTVKARAEEKRYTKSAILKSSLFTTFEKDCLSFLLRDGNMYTLSEVKQILEEYLSTPVKPQQKEVMK